MGSEQKVKIIWHNQNQLCLLCDTLPEVIRSVLRSAKMQGSPKVVPWELRLEPLLESRLVDVLVLPRVPMLLETE